MHNVLTFDGEERAVLQEGMPAVGQGTERCRSHCLQLLGAQGCCAAPGGCGAWHGAVPPCKARCWMPHFCRAGLKVMSARSGK